MSVRVMDINWEVLGNWGGLVTLIMAYVVQNVFLHKSNLILYTPLPHLSPYFLLCPPGLQSADPHTFSLFDKCFFRFPNSPETWLTL